MSSGVLPISVPRLSSSRGRSIWRATISRVAAKQKAYSTAPAIGTLFGEIGEHLDGAPDIKMLTPIVAGDPAKGQLRA